MQRRRCGVCDHEDELPHHLCCRPNDRVYAEVRDGEEDLSSPLCPPFLVYSLLSRCASSPCSAERYAPRSEHHCGTSSCVKTSQNLGNRRVRAASFGGPSVTVEHESIRHEVFTAAATAAAEAEKVGEQRRRFCGRGTQPNVALRHAGATQELVDVVVDADNRLPLAVHRHVRLDAGVPPSVDAAPGRLLRHRRSHRVRES